MSVPVHLLIELLPTLGAAELHDPCVHILVPLQLVGGYKSLATDIAAVRLLPCVDFFMVIKRKISHKLLATLLTSKIPLSSVCCHNVSPQNLLVGKASCTQITFMLCLSFSICMGVVQMIFESQFVFEYFGTDGANTVDIIMASHVSFHTFLSREQFSTDFTTKFTFTPVIP